MKNFMILVAMMMISVSSFAKFNQGKVRSFRYPVKFSVDTVSLLCPKNESGISCKALGSVITVKTKLNTCIDKIIEFTAHTIITGQGTVEVHISAIAEYDPLSPSTECLVQNIVHKNVSTLLENIENIEIVNK